MKKNQTFLLLALSLSSSVLYAEALTDGSVGAIKTLSGQFEVPASLGTTSGNNLFHSFKTFNLNSGESATFTGPDNISNVISRVTGGKESNINGLLQSKVGEADFYFINPAGIVFGKEAQLNVPAAFHAAASEQLQFKDGTIYSTTNLKNNQLSIASPEKFGLLAANNTNNYLNVSGAILAVNKQQTLELTAPKLNINSNALVFASEGNVQLNTNQLSIDQSKIVVDAYGEQKAGNVDINAQQVAISNGAVISSHSNSTGSGGLISVNANALNLDGKNLAAFTGLAANANSTGQAGQVKVQTQSLAILGGAQINSSTFSLGNAGQVSVNSQDISIDGSDSSIGSNANANSTGNAGSIEVSTNHLKITNGGSINSGTSSSGNAGSVSVDAQKILVDGQNNPTSVTGISTSTNGGSGIAGQVTINTKELTILNTGEIGSNSFGAGSGGSVQINSNTINIDGKGSADNRFTGISSNVTAQGNAGNLLLNAKAITLSEKGRIQANTRGAGQGGSVTINSDELNINGNNNSTFTGIASNTFAQGDAGVVSVNAKNITIENAGRITTNTRGLGKAGNLQVSANILNIDAKNSVYLAGIAAAASPESGGEIGNIEVKTNQLAISNGGQISIQNRAQIAHPETIKAGTISIQARDIALDHGLINAQSTGNVDASNIQAQISNSLRMNFSSVSMQAQSGNGGNVLMNTGLCIDLQHSSITTSVLSAAGNGGDITVSTPNLVLDNGAVQANAVSGYGGDVFIDVKDLVGSQSLMQVGGAKPLLWNGNTPDLNIIQAASQYGLSGNVKVTSPQVNLSGVLFALNTTPFDSNMLRQDFCALGVGSTLTPKGLGALPRKPSELF